MLYVGPVVSHGLVSFGVAGILRLIAFISVQSGTREVAVERDIKR
jgi:hypothetical protein